MPLRPPCWEESAISRGRCSADWCSALIGALSRGYVSEHWADGIIFGILILILVFRPTGLLGERTGEKV